MDRPELETEEIEITPEMVRAGANVIDRLARDVRDGWVGPEEAAAQVWSVMSQLRRRDDQTE